MQEDMHYYAVYALARAAGVKPGTAGIIACASQFVDDATENDTVVLGNQMGVIPTITSHKPTDYQNWIGDDQWYVWACFHFIPGNTPAGKGFSERMVCREDSGPAKSVLEYALSMKTRSYGPHMAGIVAHAYADTFSHFGFIGIRDEWNLVDADTIKLFVQDKSIESHLRSKLDSFLSKITAELAEALPVGHAAVATLPDRPYLHWKYKTREGKTIERHNTNDYLEACRELHSFFGRFLDGNPTHGSAADARAWQDIESEVKDLLANEANMEDRIAKWKKAISEGKLFDALGQDTSIEYNSKGWCCEGIKDHFGRNRTLSGCDGYQFFKAARKYQKYMIGDLLPSLGLLA